MEVYRGKGVCPGIAIGPIFLLNRPRLQSPSPTLFNIEWELDSYEKAKEKTDRQLEALYKNTLTELGEDEASIIHVQRHILQDVEFVASIREAISERGFSALRAIQWVGNHYANMFRELPDAYLQARATDVLDISRRLSDNLSGSYAIPKIPRPSIILADELTPSEALQLDRKNILAFATRKGSPNAHATILARILNIPTTIQIDFPAGDAFLNSGNSPNAALDATTGILYLNPDVQTLANLRRAQVKQSEEQQQLNMVRGLPTITQCGQGIQLFANIGGLDGMYSAIENDAEGIGLFRTEFLYIGRRTFPSEEEQYQIYRAVAEGMKGKQVVIRTADIGADKNADYLQLPPEDNPALGYRGIRLGLDRPDMFRTQIRAILRAASHGDIALLLPMITAVWEVRTCRKIIEQTLNELRKDGIRARDIPVGVMVETPAAVIIAPSLAAECDFFSVGTNDLTQYSLALDRKSPHLDAFSDPRHPAVLAMLEMVAHSAQVANIPVSICGELATDTRLAKSFIRMGYNMLSVPPGGVLRLRRHIRNLSLSKNHTV